MGLWHLYCQSLSYLPPPLKPHFINLIVILSDSLPHWSKAYLYKTNIASTYDQKFKKKKKCVNNKLGSRWVQVQTFSVSNGLPTHKRPLLKRHNKNSPCEGNLTRQQLRAEEPQNSGLTLCKLGKQRALPQASRLDKSVCSSGKRRECTRSTADMLWLQWNTQHSDKHRRV